MTNRTDLNNKSMSVPRFHRKLGGRNDTLGIDTSPNSVVMMMMTIEVISLSTYLKIKAPLKTITKRAGHRCFPEINDMGRTWR